MPESQQFAIKKSESWQMFNDISPRYDFLNRVLSFGLDLRWRKILAKHLPNRPNLKVVDLATGTADVLLSMARRNPNFSEGVGIDMADKMLEIGRQKIAAKQFDQKIKLESGDAHAIAYPDNSFDAATIAFGIRNMSDPAKVILEMTRVLKPGGVVLVLEFSLPKNKIIRFFHLAYLRHVVPAIGWLLTGHYKAYKYLNETIEDFPYGNEFCYFLYDAGLAHVKPIPLLFGTATIYRGEKIK